MTVVLSNCDMWNPPVYTSHTIGERCILTKNPLFKSSTLLFLLYFLSFAAKTELETQDKHLADTQKM